MSYRLSESTDAARGRGWAMGLGVLAGAGGLLLAGLALAAHTSRLDVTAYNMAAGLLTAVGGAASVYLARRLGDPDTARPSHFTALQRLYVAALVVIILGDVERLVRGEGVGGILRYPFVGWALVLFSRGRQELEEARREGAVRGGASTV